MRFLIVGDLHGNMPKFYRKDFDAIIAPGDFCSDAPRKYMFQVIRERMQNPKSKVEWYDLAGRKKAKKMIKKSLLDGRKILEKLNSFGVPVYIAPGNWDWTGHKNESLKILRKNHYKDLIKGLSNIKDTYHKRIDIGDYEIIGHGITSGPEYPVHKEDLKRMDKKKLSKKKKEYNRLFLKVDKLFKKSKKPVIFISHNVPFNTKVDKIRNINSPRNGMHYGSLITRNMIDKYQPLVCIGGHMHEHFGKDKVKNTVVINAGFGSNVNVWMELENNKVKKLQFLGKN